MWNQKASGMLVQRGFSSYMNGGTEVKNPDTVGGIDTKR